MSKIRCPNCKSEKTIVEKTKNYEDKIFRYKICQNGHKFRTVETYIDYERCIKNIKWELDRISKNI